MKIFAPLFALLSALVLMAGFAAPASADIPGNHPAYLHALGDLRYAHALINHGDYKPGVDAQEDMALDDIQRAYYEIKKAGIDDGKDINMHDIDPGLDHRGRLHRAIEALNRVRADLAAPETNPEAISLQKHAARHAGDAIMHVRKAIAFASA